jgi:hypothetical protein
VERERRVNYKVLSATEEKVVLQDLGPWDEYLTITNGIEHVVGLLVEEGLLKSGTLLYYYDSEGEYTGVTVRGGKFVGFYWVFPPQG